MKQRWKWGWILSGPAVFALSVVAGWPLLRTLYLSFRRSSMEGTEGKWVGFKHYILLSQDPEWWQAVCNTLVFTVTSVSLEALLGLGIAVLLNKQLKGRGILRAAVLIPWAIPAVVSAKMWAWMFNDTYGIINQTLMNLSLIDQPIAWLAEDSLSLLVVIAVDVWKTTPFMALLLLAGLQSIPKSLYEAASIDGIARWRCFRYITLPHLMPALCVALIFRTLDALRVFDLVYVLTSNSSASATISVYARQQLVDFQDFGYGSAASIFTFLIIGAVIWLYLMVGKQHLGIEK